MAMITPSFDSAAIQTNRSDGYWVESIKVDSNDKVPGIIASGLVSGVVELLDNPLANGKGDVKALSQAWPKYEIGRFNSPVAICTVDISGNGLCDVVVCHSYGPFMLQCDPEGGWITWLENPGRENFGKGHWKQRTIGRWPAMHRIKAGHFTQKSYLEVIAASVVRSPHDKVTPIPIIRFQRPEKVLDALEWHRDIIDDENFSVIHEVTVKKFDGPEGLDSMLISSREGVKRLFYKNQRWNTEVIGIGELKEDRQDPWVETPGSGDHWGSGCADAGKVGSDPFAYVATLDPFHGTSVCVYVKDNHGMSSYRWKRHVLDVYGTPNQRLKTGDGPLHFVVCADFDGDGDDEFLVSMFGPLDRDEEGNSIPPPPGPHVLKGIMYYKAIDVQKGLFSKWKITPESSARIAIGDFSGTGRLDLVSMGYNVKLYYEEPQPVVTLHLNNTIAPAVERVESQIITTAWDGEGMTYLPLPTSDPTDPKRIKRFRHAEKLDLLDVAGYRVSVEILPFNSTTSVGEGSGIKVLYGSVNDGHQERSPFSVAPFTASTTRVKSGSVQAGPVGAIILRFKPVKSFDVAFGEADDFVTVANVPVRTLVQPVKADFASMNFTKVEELAWGEKFKGMDFCNLSGFSFSFLETKDFIAHLQFWTAGANVNCGVHNHSDEMFQEVHVCLSPGTGDGGMWKLKSDDIVKDVPNLDTLGPEHFDKLPLGRLEEHGGLWERDSYGKAFRAPDRRIIYPYHKWQAGKGPNLDVWAAIEFNPDLVYETGKRSGGGNVTHFCC
ncbi:aldos-2-ulose dehydratase-like protein [Elsinoe australis]|uniref:Aldos-2-ulose dehydratase-like protein n=1 Tax=Elsinoe australis TaxID=40998 RepID=A0A2P7YL06_9PEZI|nr:hypothetical protein B9Z65_1807 [Elsinoe australis]TKX18261.1 aldos-2-ulose dehydratase-like protein [Elsinoe australis]